MNPFFTVLLLISAFVLLTAAMPIDEDAVQNHRHKRSFKQLPTGLLEPIIPLVKALVPEPLLGKITMLLPLPAASDSTMPESISSIIDTVAPTVGHPYNSMCGVSRGGRGRAIPQVGTPYSACPGGWPSWIPPPAIVSATSPNRGPERSK